MAHLVGCCVCVCCVLCFVLSPKQSGVLECHLSHISKNENNELCILVGFFVTTGKKSSSRLSGRCTVIITTGKKSSSCLSGGCTIVITTGTKNVRGVCLAGARSLLRLKIKKSSSRLSGRCAIIITTGKKNSSHLSGGLCCCVSF